MACVRKACLRKAYRGLGLLLFCATGALFPLHAQKVVSARAGLITYLQGSAFVDGKRVALKTARFPQMKDGESFSTGRGRAELLLAPGVILRLAENSQVRMDDTRLADTRVTLQRGDALIEVVQLAEGNRIQVASGRNHTELTSALACTDLGQRKRRCECTAGRHWSGPALTMASAKRGMAVDLDTGLNTSLNPGLPVRQVRPQADGFPAHLGSPAVLRSIHERPGGPPEADSLANRRRVRRRTRISAWSFARSSGVRCRPR